MTRPEITVSIEPAANGWRCTIKRNCRTLWISRTYETPAEAEQDADRFLSCLTRQTKNTAPSNYGPIH